MPARAPPFRKTSSVVHVLPRGGSRRAGFRRRPVCWGTRAARGAGRLCAEPSTLPAAVLRQRRSHNRPKRAASEAVRCRRVCNSGKHHRSAVSLGAFLGVTLLSSWPCPAQSASAALRHGGGAGTGPTSVSIVSGTIVGPSARVGLGPGLWSPCQPSTCPLCGRGPATQPLRASVSSPVPDRRRGT